MTPEALKTLLAPPIAFHKVFAVISGDTLTGLFLAQCYYWAQKTTDPDGWFHKSREEWHEETLMTRRQQESAREALRDIGVLEESQRGGRSRDIYFRVNIDRLAELVTTACQPAKRNSSPIPVCTDAEAQNVPMQRAETYLSIGTKRTDATVQNVPMQKPETYQCTGTDTPLVIGTETTAEITTETTAKSNTGSDEPCPLPSPKKPGREETEKMTALFRAFRAVRFPGHLNPTHTDLREYSQIVKAAVKDGRTPEEMQIATRRQIEERAGTEFDVTIRSVLKYFDSLLEKANGNANRNNPTNRTDNRNPAASEHSPNGRGTGGMVGTSQTSSPSANGQHGGQRRSKYPQAGEIQPEAPYGTSSGPTG